jgi:hypothetical protein
MRGGPEMGKKLGNIRRLFPDEVGRALYQETQIENTEVKKRTPVDKGILRGTVHAIGPMRSGNRIWTLIVCGGPAAPYAIWVHENLRADHSKPSKHGGPRTVIGQAKFLESVILESRPYIAARVSRRIDLNRMAAGG